MKQHLPLFWPEIYKQEWLRALAKVFDSRWIGQGPLVDQFEQKFGHKMGYKYPVMVNSGTAALELAYHLLDLKPGDTVIVPVLNAICGQVGLIRRQCRLLFCDIERTSLNIDPVHLEKLLEKNKVRAVVSVHLGGIHFNRQVYSVCHQFKVPLIVDSAQYPAPTQGEYICYSFQAIKHLTTSDGGMLVLSNRRDYVRAKKLRWFGIPRNHKKSKDSWRERGITAAVPEAGYKYQPTDIDACLGLASLPHLDGVIAYRKRLAHQYRQELDSVKQVQVVAADTCWLLTILAQQRNRLADYLTRKGIETNLVHIRNDRYRIFSHSRLNLPNMNWVEKRYLCLPLNSKIKPADVTYICRSINSFYDQS